MKRGRSPNGFTIVETLIFLAVSGAVLLSSIAVITQSQNKNQFNQAINDVNQQISTIINNVANGYYSRGGNLQCSVQTNDLRIQNGSDARGSTKSCIFIGRVAQFYSNQAFFDVYGVAGARTTGGVNPVEVTSLTQAKATAMPNPQRIDLKNGIRIVSIKYAGGTSGAVGFFTSFGKIAGDQLESNNLVTDFAPITGTLLTTDNVARSLINSSFRSQYDSNAIKNPPSGIELCFRSGTNNEFGVITIGGDNQSANTSLQIKGSCS